MLNFDFSLLFISEKLLFCLSNYLQMKTIVYLGTKSIGLTCLQYLLKVAGSLHAKVIAVGTKSNNEKFNTDIEYLSLQNRIALLPSLEEIPDCDILISVQYHRILKPRHIQKARQIAVNLHMAPLPEYRGCNQFSFAILDKAKVFGTTLHRLEEGIDNGAILFEKRFPIPDNCWITELYELTENASNELFCSHLSDIVTGNYTPVLQEHLIPVRGTSYHYRHEIEQIKQIDLNWDAEKIARHIRATYFPPFKPPYCLVDGVRFNFEKELF